MGYHGKTQGTLPQRAEAHSLVAVVDFFLLSKVVLFGAKVIYRHTVLLSSGSPGSIFQSHKTL